MCNVLGRRERDIFFSRLNKIALLSWTKAARAKVVREEAERDFSADPRPAAMLQRRGDVASDFGRNV